MRSTARCSDWVLDLPVDPIRLEAMDPSGKSSRLGGVRRGRSASISPICRQPVEAAMKYESEWLIREVSGVA